MGSGSVTMLKLQQVLQSKVIRIMVFKVQKDCVRMSTVYKSLNMLQIADIYELEIAKFMHCFYHKNLPAVFGNYFKSANSHHTHNAKSITQKSYYLQRMNSHYGQSSCFFMGTKLWNNIPCDIKLLSKFTFNKLIKKNLISKYH